MVGQYGLTGGEERTQREIATELGIARRLGEIPPGPMGRLLTLIQKRGSAPGAGSLYFSVLLSSVP